MSWAVPYQMLYCRRLPFPQQQQLTLLSLALNISLQVWTVHYLSGLEYFSASLAGPQLLRAPTPESAICPAPQDSARVSIWDKLGPGAVQKLPQTKLADQKHRKVWFQSSLLLHQDQEEEEGYNWREESLPDSLGRGIQGATGGSSTLLGEKPRAELICKHRVLTSHFNT